LSALISSSGVSVGMLESAARALGAQAQISASAVKDKKRCKDGITMLPFHYPYATAKWPNRGRRVIASALT
jgi:hypothetical protein